MKIKLNKATVNYEIIGSGIPIVMFNGFATDKKMMKGCMEPIFNNKSGWKRVYLDHPGVGKTEIHNNFNDYRDVFEVVEEFISKIIRSKKFILAGYSFGGFLARYILSKMINKVEGLLLICPVVIPNLDNAHIDEKIDTDVINDSKRIDKRVEREVKKSMQNTDFNFLENLRNKAENNVKRENNNINHENVYKKPVLILTGKQDIEVGYKDAFELLNFYPRATYCALDKAGHNLHIEQEKLFNNLVNEWLKRVNKNM